MGKLQGRATHASLDQRSLFVLALAATAFSLVLASIWSARLESAAQPEQAVNFARLVKIATCFTIAYINIVVALDGRKRALQLVDEHGGGYERNAEARGIAQQQYDALGHRCLLGGQHERRPEEGPHARRPADGEDDAEQHRREESKLAPGQGVLAPAEQVHLDEPEEVQAEGDDH